MYPNSGDVSLGSSKCAATEINLSFINKFVNYHSLQIITKILLTHLQILIEGA